MKRDRIASTLSPNTLGRALAAISDHTDTPHFRSPAYAFSAEKLTNSIPCVAIILPVIDPIHN